MKKEKFIKDIKILSLLLIWTALQPVLTGYIKIFNVGPNLSLAMVVIYGLVSRSRMTLIFCLAAGFLNDIFSSQFFGLNTLIFVLVGYIILKLSKKFLIESLVLQLVIISGAVILQGFIFQLTFSFYSSGLPTIIFLRSVFLSVVYTALLSPLAIKAIRYI